MSKEKFRFFPKGSVKVTPKNVDSVVIGLYEYEAVNKKRYFGFIAYSGKRTKPDAYFRYSTLQERDKGIARYVDQMERIAEHKAQVKNNRVLKENPVQIGDVFYTSWGYDQTNVEFFQVVGVKGVSVELREVAQNYEETGFMSGNTSPRKNVFLINSPIIRKRVQTYDGGKSVYLRISDCRSAWIYDNRPKYTSSYA